jgi:hypothetical protein
MLPALVVLTVALQTPPQTQAVVRDSVPADSIKRDTPRRLPVTAALLASAFRDEAARELYNRARATRVAQDSAIVSYDAKVRQRMSVYASIGRLGRPHLAYRTESAARVQWQRGVGAHIELTGARGASPLIGSRAFDSTSIEGELDGSDMSPVPYFPGSEALWAGGPSMRSDVDERQIVHPLARGAEAYYTYRTGDSLTFRLPDGRAVRLRELEVRPRRASFNLTVGSLWFDTESGQLVRAAFRLAAPAAAGVNVSAGDSARRAAKLAGIVVSALISPTRAEISAVVIEYGLYEGRFWLPRQQSMEGYLQAAFAHIPMRYENSFTYTSVNGPMSLAAVRVDTAATSRGDSVRAGKRYGSFAQCDSSAVRVVTRNRYESNVPVRMTIPCSLEALAHSPDLPKSIYDTGEDLFNSDDRMRLIGEALSMAAQAPFGSLSRARWQYGASMTRYNRVEGFSSGLAVEKQLGAGLAVNALARLGGADLVPNGELSFARSNLRRTLRITGYERLVSAGDWGRPLNFGSSLGAFFFGRDEGFYYRATGVELTSAGNQSAGLEWRAFLEQQRDAPPNATFSLGGTFGPNIVADGGIFGGVSVRSLRAFGVDPHGFRAFTDFRMEGAGSDTASYGRVALDLTVSRDLFGKFTSAITVAGGTSVGSLPSQRRWFLGGTQTVRGQSADTAQSGNAFWLGKLELARQVPGVRFSLFGDLGWAGDRTKLSDVGRPLSGAGIGMSAFDGLIRFDVARGIYPREQTRVVLYLDARF